MDHNCNPFNSDMKIVLSKNSIRHPMQIVFYSSMLPLKLEKLIVCYIIFLSFVRAGEQNSSSFDSAKLTSLYKVRPMASIIYSEGLYLSKPIISKLQSERRKQKKDARGPLTPLKSQ